MYQKHSGQSMYSFQILEGLIQEQYPLIACESPLQERLRLLTHISQFCQTTGNKCYLWNLGEESIKELTVENSKLAIGEFKGYIPKPKHNKEDYFHILNFWKEYQESGVLIVENIYPWIQENSFPEAEFLLISEWIKYSLINIKLYNQNTGKVALLLGATADISSDIAAEIPIWKQDLPDVGEIIKSLIQGCVLPPEYADTDYLTVAIAGMGLYISDILNLLACIRKTTDFSNSGSLAQSLLKQKIQRHVDRWIAGSLAIDNFMASGFENLPDNEFVLTPIASLPPNEQVEIWMQTSKESHKPPTGVEVEAARKAFFNLDLKETKNNWSGQFRLKDVQTGIKSLPLAEMKSFYSWLRAEIKNRELLEKTGNG
jgi:hypothetical protein